MKAFRILILSCALFYLLNPQIKLPQLYAQSSNTCIIRTHSSFFTNRWSNLSRLCPTKQWPYIGLLEYRCYFTVVCGQSWSLPEADQIIALIRSYSLHSLKCCHQQPLLTLADVPHPGILPKVADVPHPGILPKVADVSHPIKFRRGIFSLSMRYQKMCLDRKSCDKRDLQSSRLSFDSEPMQLDPLLPRWVIAPKPDVSKRETKLSKRETWPPSFPEQWPNDWPEDLPSTPSVWPHKWAIRGIEPPPPIEDMLRQARSLTRLRQFGQASQIYRQILSYQPQHIEVLHSLARLYAWQKLYALARQIYEDVLTYSPGDLEAMRGLGDLAYWQGHTAEAIAWYSIYLRHHPEDLRVQKNLARAARDSDKDEQAKLAYRQILKLQPNDREAKLYLAPQPRFSLHATTHQGFWRDAFRQDWLLGFGFRLWQQLWISLEADLRTRFYPTQNFADLFLSGTIYWSPWFWRRLSLSLQTAGSPFYILSPRFYFNFDTAAHFHWFEIHLGYRYFLFPKRDSHILTPGLSLHFAPIHIHIRYFMNFSQLSPESAHTLKHAVFGYVRWKMLDWFSPVIGGGGGNVIDYLSDYAQPFLLLPDLEARHTTAYNFHLRAGIEFQIALQQELSLEYLYQREVFQPPSKLEQPQVSSQVHIDLHTLSLNFRWRF